MGHTSASYREPLFVAHLLGAIEMAAGDGPFPCAAAWRSTCGGVRHAASARRRVAVGGVDHAPSKGRLRSATAPSPEAMW